MTPLHNPVFKENIYTECVELYAQLSSDPSTCQVINQYEILIWQLSKHSNCTYYL